MYNIYRKKREGIDKMDKTYIFKHEHNGKEFGERFEVKALAWTEAWALATEREGYNIEFVEVR